MERVIRGSEYQDFLRCRQRWHWGWQEGYKSRNLNDKLYFGNLFHKFLEVLYDQKDIAIALSQMGEMYRESQDNTSEIRDVYELAKTVATNYIDEYWQMDQFMEVLETEFHFEIPLVEGITFEGTIDMIYKDHEGKVWFMDHKTTASLDKYEKNSVMDRQISRYWWALEKLGYEVGGFIYNIILKDFPVPPKQIANGAKLSKAKAQNTTYELYLNTIRELGFIPEDYEDILDYFQENPREYFRRVVVRRNKEEVKAAMLDFFYTAKDMQDARIYKNITSDCSWDCQFRDVCLASLDGSNVQLLLNTIYTKEDVHD